MAAHYSCQVTYWSFRSPFIPKGEELVSEDLHLPNNGSKTFLNFKGREGEKMNKDAQEKWGDAEAERKGGRRRREQRGKARGRVMNRDRTVKTGRGM